jgi:hypothetical protein
MTRPEKRGELLRPIEELPDEAPPSLCGAADGQLFPAPRRPCRKHDARPVPPVERPVVGLPLPRPVRRDVQAGARVGHPVRDR